MSRRLIFIAIAASMAALAAPAGASAGEWSFAGGHQFFSFSSVGKTLITTNQGETFTCETETASGTINEAGTGGTISLTLHGCKEDSANTTCTTTGQSAGTILVSGTWESVYLSDDKTKPGFKITGAGETEELALAKCGFGLVTIKFEGSIIGEVEQPCQTIGKEFSIGFESIEHGVQKYMQNTATGQKTDLKLFRNGVERTGSIDGTGTAKLERESELSCL